MATTAPYHFSVAQLQNLKESDLPRLREESCGKWEEACMWLGGADYDRDYRARRIAEERERLTARRAPAPTPAPAPSHANCVSQSALLGVVSTVGRVVGDYLKESVLPRISVVEERASSHASASLVADLGERILALEARLAQADQRFDAQARHLRNLQTQVSGVGKVERSPKGE